VGRSLGACGEVMASLSEAQLGSVKLLIQTAPDSAIRNLEETLSSGAERHETMRVIQQMVAVEAADRRGRNAVFSPLTPMCGGKAGGPRRLRFPGSVLAQLWRGLRDAEPHAVQAVIVATNNPDPETDAVTAMDSLSRKAAQGLRARSNPGFEAAAAALDK